jgi:hypothetical protein
MQMEIPKEPGHENAKRKATMNEKPSRTLLSFQPPSAEDLAKLETLPIMQYIEHIKLAMYISGMDILKEPGLTARQRLQIMDELIRMMHS